MAHGIPSIPLAGYGSGADAATAAFPRAAGETGVFDNLTDGRLLDFLRGLEGESAAGERVTPDSALRTGTAFRCVTLITGAVATLPLDLKRRVNSRERRDADDHPLWKVLRKRPNPWQTPSQFRRYMQACVLLRKGGFARIVRSGRKIVALIPLHPDRVEVRQNADLSLTFRYTRPNGGTIDLDQADVFHLCGLTLDGVNGVSVLTYAREAVGEALATARHSGTLFRNGTAIGGVITAEEKLSAEAQELLRASLEAYRGASNAHKNLILQKGMKYDRLGLSSVDAQFIQSREFSQFEIAMFFGVPPHMLGLMQKSTSFGSGIEQMSQGFVAYTLQDWLTMWSEAIGRDLIGDDEPQLYAHFNINALVRGDIRTRYAAYAVGRQWGWLSANDVLEKEDENAIEGGDTYLDPMNMKHAGQPPSGPEPEPRDKPNDDS